MTESGGRRPLAAAATLHPRRSRRAITTRGVIRRLWPGERARLQAHLLRLDREDRILRFGGYASDAQIAAYCKRLDWRHALVVGYVVRGKVRGLGQLEPIQGSSPRAAEVAVSVERPFQNRGVGSALLRRVVSAARNRLIERIYMVCLVDNGRALRMARRLDGTLRFHQGEAAATIEPPWPTPWTWLEELLLEPALTGVDLARPLAAARPDGGGAQPDAATMRSAPGPTRQPMPPSSHQGGSGQG